MKHTPYGAHQSNDPPPYCSPPTGARTPRRLDPVEPLHGICDRSFAELVEKPIEHFDGLATPALQRHVTSRLGSPLRCDVVDPGQQRRQLGPRGRAAPRTEYAPIP